jgi:ABC-type polysaccharide/polyol phosphate export permease
MAPESWLKISLPAFPVAFTVLGIWLYWGENPLPLLAPSIAFWGLVVLFYLFSHLEAQPNKNYQLILIIAATVLWLVSAITSHNLGKFVTSNRYSGLGSIFSTKDFWYAYICSTVACATGLLHFIRYEPEIVEQIKKDRERIAEGV